ncbi:ATP-dependent helicase [Thermoactinomyces mirandus]|uniref:DNA 3'-5' helicase n=1 Tax=Thermoactinomyces mirandus TaxID=2756294 RepID=A0A7W2ASP9_9BACL|nr:ATP-dependent helicase [Thermoactinomyces mirandus]MBA4603833.1 ATP-dependent helicase [Thermoactinomyces mirandus]
MLTGATDLILSGLNEKQREAVIADEKPTVVFAGPGSGKTTVLTRRVLYLLEQGACPEKLMAVTFTRAAAQEMKARLQEVMPKSTQKLWIGTFHSLFLTILREKSEAIPSLLKGNQQKEIIRKILSVREQPTDEENIEAYLNQIGLCKGNAILLERMNVQKRNILFREISSEYENWKQKNNFWDYDDILLEMYQRVKTSEELAELKGRFVQVDEFQDINWIQYQILVKLVSQHRSLFVVGDDDQSIYGFRGSNPRIMLQLHKDFPDLQRIVLPANYRSTEPIIQANNQLIRQNRLRQAKPFQGLGIDGAKVEWIEPQDENEEAERIIFRIKDGVETAVLFRTATQARALTDVLVRKGISFFIPVEHSFYRRWQVQDVFAYFRLANNPNDLDALVRIINRPKRYLFGEEWIDACRYLSKKTNRTVLDALPDLSRLDQVRHLRELSGQIRCLRQLAPVDAIPYIRATVGYDRFLEDFARGAGTDLEHLLEPLDELMVAAELFPDLLSMIKHASRVEEALKQSHPAAKIKLMTLHRSKGLEFDRVFIIGLHAMIIPHYRSLNVPEYRKNEVWEEERRLLYVGMTRARKELILSSTKTRQGKRAHPSPFLRDIDVVREHAKQELIVDQNTSKMVQAMNRKELDRQPQMRFIHEKISVGSEILHTRFGKGIVEDVVSIEGVAPRQKDSGLF